jgi:hypothetical protein
MRFAVLRANKSFDFVRKRQQTEQITLPLRR